MGSTMCLGIPGKVIDTYEEHEVLMGKVDFGGVIKRVCLEHTREVQPGRYVIVHVGFALQVIDEEEAQAGFRVSPRNEQDGRIADCSGVASAEGWRAKCAGPCDEVSG